VRENVEIDRRMLLRLFARQADPYAGADLGNARRMMALNWVLGTALGIAMLPLSDGGRRFGLVGWLALIAMVPPALAVGRWLVDSTRRITFNHLLAVSYSGLAALTVATWLTGGATSLLRQLYLLVLLGAVGVHPPRRAGVFLLCTCASVSAPLAYDGWDGAAAKDTAARMMLWFSLAVLAMVLMSYIRRQRVALAASARVDALTGLGNRRAFEEAVTAEVARSRRAGAPTTLLLLDIDDFKSTNDRHGHLEGDRCLRSVAAALSQAVRADDRCYRWGGDEFAVLLGSGEGEGTDLIRVRLVQAVRATCLDADGAPLQVTCGVAQLEDGDAGELIALADAELMTRKRRKSAAAA
jgi:diguanylate cyclase (GGDEF)-like protein